MEKQRIDYVCLPRGCKLKFWFRGVSLIVVAIVVNVLLSSQVLAEGIDEINNSREVRGTQTTRIIQGRVIDSDNEPMPGVAVLVKGTTNGTVTDFDGNYSIKVEDGSQILVFSFIGMTTVEKEIGSLTTINVVLEDATKDLEEVVVVAYGAQKKETLTGAISSVGGDELVKIPTGSVSNALSGVVTGLSSVQYSGEPGADDADLYIRGIATSNNSAPLVQVDGVEREFSQLDPNEIESITVLKDASATAVFGVRGANGVILITTKRGKEGKAKISASTSMGYQVPSKLLDFANSYQYASFYNEAQLNDGVQGDLKFSDTVLEAFRTHSDPVVYPDMDWMDYLLKSGAKQSQHNINISGGAEKVRYFVSVGAYTQEGLFKTFDAGYDFNFKYNRYNYRANIDFDLSKSTLLSVNLGGRASNKTNPISKEDQNQLFRMLYWATPFGGAGFVNGKRIVTSSNIIATPGIDGLEPYYGKGYYTTSNNVLNVDVVLTQDLEFITKGLNMKIKGSYNSSYTHTKTRSGSVAYYTPAADGSGNPLYNSDGDLGLIKNGEDSQLSFGQSFGQGRDWYAEASLNYNRSFGDHTLGGLLLYNESKYYFPKDYTDIPSGYVGMVGRLTYDWKTKYMAEFNAGYNGSENFARDQRYGFFPSGSVGWVVSEENFMSSVKGVVNYLKLRASYGVVGNDKYWVGDTQQRFLYIPDSYGIDGGGYNFGTDNSSNKTGAYESSISNKDVTWEKAYKQNYGIDVAFVKEKLKLSVDVFKEHREDILMTNSSVPGFIGVSIPAVNLGVVDNHGYEVVLKWEDKLRPDLRYWVNANLSYARNKWIEKGEVKPNEEYMTETGQPIGQPFVASFWGFYDDTANERYKEQYGTDIADHSVQLQPGDAVFVDLNKDGVIDSDDVTKHGYTDNPEYVLGLSGGFSWKNLDFSMQWTGGFHSSRLLEEVFREPLGDTNAKGLLLYQYEQRWTPETASSAKLPRASLNAKSNNYRGSDLFLVDASYMRLKNVEIGYNLKLPVFEQIGMGTCRFYVSGYNLLTFSGFKYGDPESKTSSRPSYPLTRVYNVGLKIGF